MRKGSILEGTRVSCRTFVNTVQLFADDVSVNDAARRLGTAYNTTYDTYARIRKAILADDPPVGTSHSDGVASGTKQLVVFGIRMTDGKITIEPVESPDPSLITALPIPTMQRGNILFIDAYGKKYQGFITYAPYRRGHEFVRIRPADGFPWSPLAGFWDFAGKSWMNHRGIARERIPEFLQELTQRYNSRDTDRFQEILKQIAACEYPPACPVQRVRQDKKTAKSPGS
jgi:hypothetical protein